MERSDDYMGKITMDALDRQVILDASIVIQRLGQKLKAYCSNTNTYVRFPRDIRIYGKRFVADVVKVGRTGGTVFYRAYKQSVRETKDGPVIA